jgi:hypothetical protein
MATIGTPYQRPSVQEPMPACVTNTSAKHRGLGNRRAQLHPVRNDAVLVGPNPFGCQHQVESPAQRITKSRNTAVRQVCNLHGQIVVLGGEPCQDVPQHVLVLLDEFELRASHVRGICPMSRTAEISQT